jgi:hypothetical protein
LVGDVALQKERSRKLGDTEMERPRPPCKKPDDITKKKEGMLFNRISGPPDLVEDCKNLFNLLSKKTWPWEPIFAKLIPNETVDENRFKCPFKVTDQALNKRITATVQNKISEVYPDYRLGHAVVLKSTPGGCMQDFHTDFRWPTESDPPPTPLSVMLSVGPSFHLDIFTKLKPSQKELDSPRASGATTRVKSVETGSLLIFHGMLIFLSFQVVTL